MFLFVVNKQLFRTLPGALKVTKTWQIVYLFGALYIVFSSTHLVKKTKSDKFMICKYLGFCSIYKQNLLSLFTIQIHLLHFF